MANPQHLKILKQGVETWNAWRSENREVRPELVEVDLTDTVLAGADLSGANLAAAQLSEVDLTRANLSNAYCSGADFKRANLASADLTEINLTRTSFRDARLTMARLTLAGLGNADLANADLAGVDLRGTHLERANLSNANLTNADFSFFSVNRMKTPPGVTHATGIVILGSFWGAIVGDIFGRAADLSDADLSGANLIGADFTNACLSGTKIRNASVGLTTFGDIDLSSLEDLEAVRHIGPSTLGTDSLQRSQGNLPEVFLKGCGLSDWEIEAAKLWNPELSEHERIDITDEIHRLRGEQPIQVNRLFISYSPSDVAFVEQLEQQFDKRGIRYWRDVHDMKAGRVETQIDRAIRLNPTVLLVLSERSVDSDRVEWEAKKARELEKEVERDVLCPVALDDSWRTCNWPGLLRQQIEKYNVLDFSDWQDPKFFDQQFTKLVDGLGLFYSKEDSRKRM